MYGIQPSEFWDMTPLDFWMVHDGRVRQNDAKRGATKMAPAEYEEFKDRLREKGIEV